MEEFSVLSLDEVHFFVLVFFRLAGVFMLAPLFGGETVPGRLRAKRKEIAHVPAAAPEVLQVQVLPEL